MKSLSRFTLFLRIVALFYFLGSLEVNAKQNLEKVVLNLKWKHQFQFAGYYAAVEKGFYADVGLDVIINEANPEHSPVIDVLNGDANFGIANSELISIFLKGNPVVLLASIFQHSPSIILVRGSSDIYTPHDLVGKKIMIDTDERSIEILSMLKNVGVKPDMFEIVNHTHSLNDLLSGRVDAISAYSTNEPHFLDLYGIPYRIIKPSTYGVDFYSDCLFTTQEEIRNNPERVKKFIDASIKGWEYALNHKEGLASLIQLKYNPSKTFDQLMFEANAIHELINPELIEIGHTNRWRWLYMAEFMYQQGLIDYPKNIDGFFYAQNFKQVSGTNPFLKYLILLIIPLFAFTVYFTVKFYKKNNDKLLKILNLQSTLDNQNRQIKVLSDKLTAASEALEEGLKDNSTFFLGFLSQLKEPISAIESVAKDISQTGVSKEKSNQIKEDIIRYSDVLNLFFSDFASIFNLDPHSPRLNFSLVDSFAFIDEMVEKTKLYYSLSELTIESKVSAFLMSNSVIADKAKLLRIVEIFLNNSIKHSPVGRIEVGVMQHEPDEITFSVTDTGTDLKGIDLKSFNVFLSDNRNIFIKGIGYGLTLAKSLSSVMGGRIWMDFEYGKGTTFFCSIPFTQANKLSFKPAKFESLGILTANFSIHLIKDKTILVHDHQPNNHLLIRSMLSGTGCTLIFSGTTQKTIDICLGYPDIDLFLYSMRVLSNVEEDTIGQIKKFKPKLPIIGNMSFGVDQKNKFVRSGLSDVIQRPLSQAQLLAKIIEHLQ